MHRRVPRCRPPPRTNLRPDMPPRYSSPSPASTDTIEEPRWWRGRCAMPDVKSSTPVCTRRRQQIVETAIQEDVTAIGLSVLSGAHMTLFPRVVELLRGA